MFLERPVTYSWPRRTYPMSPVRSHSLCSLPGFFSRAWNVSSLFSFMPQSPELRLGVLGHEGEERGDVPRPAEEARERAQAVAADGGHRVRAAGPAVRHRALQEH